MPDTLRSKAISHHPPVALTIAGSDSSAGAGLQADLKTFAAHGIYGICAATAVVAEIPGKVTSLDPVDPALLADQLRTLASGFTIAAVKTGMLATPSVVAAVTDFLDQHPAVPAIVDPVMVATSGDRLLEKSAIALYRNRLLPRADLVTPNLAEVETLLGRPVETIDDMRPAAAALLQRFGPGAVVVKGGHLPESEDAVDYYLSRDGTGHELRTARLANLDTHGTGCTFSAAIAAQVALGRDLTGAVAEAKRYVAAAIEQSHRWSQPGGEITALNHFPIGVTSPPE